MTLRSLIVLPARDSGARLPFLLVPVLAIMALLQLAIPARIDLPPGGVVARTGSTMLPAAPPVVIAPPLLAARDLFAPPARRSGTATSDPLGGAVIAGVVQQGRLRLGVVQLPGGQVRYVGPGAAIAGWRLAALGPGEARLTHGAGQNLVVPYGMHATLPTAGATAAGAGRTPVSPQTTESGQ